MTFKEKVQTMNSGQIIMAMVAALEKPSIKINMNSYGHYSTVETWFGLSKKNVCFGCAATNTVCQIAGIKFTAENISVGITRAQAVQTDDSFLYGFEVAIDSLRKGDLPQYNYIAKSNGFAEIEDNGMPLPYLETIYTREQLDTFVTLAQGQQ